ncbi:MAG: GDP-mannose 4,6-dehydratase [Rhodospirillales bacterium]
MFNGMTCLVTGGAGFIGSHLVDGLFAAGAVKVAVVDNFFLGTDANLKAAQTRHGDALMIYREDAGDADAMSAVFKEVKPNIVFNLATKALGYSFFNPAGACSVNLDIALVLAENLRLGAYQRLIHLSTSEVYGTAQTVPMSEDHPLLAETSYAAGKAAADLLLTSYVNMFDLPIVILRPFNNYGPRQNKGSFAAIIPLTIERIRNGEAPVIAGDGSQTRDFIFVEDTVSNILRVGANKNIPNGIFNIGSGEETSIKTLVDMMCKVMDYTGDITYVERRVADVQRHMADSSRLSGLIDGLTITPLEDGMVKTVDWYLGKSANP